MKKLLALVMALVMVMGLATVGTSAAYADQDDINYEEAVDVMSAIGVLAGDETGFRPADTLKRSEGAKIVAYLLIGNKAAEALQGSGTKFTDLPANHWASGYMEYLASVGVMGGVGDGKIDPDGSLTATAFGKMLLVALGYDAEIEGFGGPDWAINVQKVANTVGLYDGNRAVVGSAAVTREEAAQYAFNALKTPIVEYDTQVQVSLENGSIKVGSNKAKPVTSAKLADQTISEDTVEAGKYYVEFAEKYYPDLELIGHDYTADEFGRPSREWTYNKADVGTYIATAGLLKTFTGEVSKQDLYNTLGKTVYDSLSDGRTSLNVAEDGLYKVVDSVALTYAADGTFTTAAVNVDNYLNRNDTGKINGAGNGSVTEVFMDEDSNIYVSTYHTYVFKAAADYSTAKETLLLEVAGDTNIVLDSLTLEAKDFEQIKDYKDDDYLLVTANRVSHWNSTSRYEVNSVEKAELVTGTVEGVKTDTNVTIDGTTYKYSAKTVNTANTLGLADVKSTAFSVGRKATVVLDKYSNIIAVDDAVVDENYVFIAALGNTNGLSTKVVADAYFTDGTNKEITISKMTVAGASVSKANMITAGTAAIDTDNANGIGVMSNGAAAQSLRAGWYTFAIDDDGEYMLTSLTGNVKETANTYQHTNTGAAAASITVVENNKVNFAPYAGGQRTRVTKLNLNLSDDGNGVLGVAANTLKANDKTIMIVADGTDVFAYTGVKNLPDITIPDDADADANDDGWAVVYAVYNTTNSYASYVFVTFEGDVDFYDAASTNLLYVISREGVYTTTNNKTYTKYNVLDESGAKIVVEADGDSPFGAGNVYKAQYRVRTNTAGRYSSGTAVGNNGSNGKYFDFNNKTTGTDPITYSAGTLTMGGQNFTLADDAKITVVSRAAALNKDKDASYEVSRVSASALASMVSGYTVGYNVQGAVDGNYGTDNNRVLKEAYITINSAVAGVAAATASTSNAIVAIQLPAASLRTNKTWAAATDEFNVYYTGTAVPGIDDILSALNNELALYGLTATAVAYNAAGANDGGAAYVFTIKSTDGLITYPTLALDVAGANDGRVPASAYTGTATISTVDATTTTLVVPKNTTLTVTANMTALTTVIVDGNLVIDNGATVGTFGTTAVDVLKSGHVTVTSGTIAGGTADIDGSSLVISSAAGAANFTTINVIGRLAVTGGTVTAKVNVNSGSVTLATTANIVGNVAVASGATLTISDDTAGVTGTLSGTGTVTLSDSSSGTASAQNASAQKPTVTITFNNADENLYEVSLVGLAVKSSSTYYVNADAATITIRNISSSAKGVTVTPGSTSGYTFTPSSPTDVAKGGTLNISMSKGSALTGAITIGVANKS